MKWTFLALFFAVSVFAQTGSVEPEQTEPKIFGQCYLTFNCIGGAIGYYDNIQCKRMGGHSIEMGGVCWPI